jgi:hypothetical protein
MYSLKHAVKLQLKKKTQLTTYKILFVPIESDQPENIIGAVKFVDSTTSALESVYNRN